MKHRRLSHELSYSRKHKVNVKELSVVRLSTRSFLFIDYNVQWEDNSQTANFVFNAQWNLDVSPCYVPIHVSILLFQCVTCSITDISCTTRQSSEQSQCSPTHSGGSSVPSSCDPSPPDADCGQGMDTDGCYSCLSLSSITEDRPGHHPSSLSVSNTTVVTGSGLCGCDEDQHSDAGKIISS